MNILAVDHQAGRRRALVDIARDAGLVVGAEASDATGAMRHLAAYPCDTLLVVDDLPDEGYRRVLRAAKAMGSPVTVVVIGEGGPSAVRDAVAAIRAGAADYLSRSTLTSTTLRESLQSLAPARGDFPSDAAHYAGEAARYRALAESSPMGIWQIDAAGKTLYGNPALCRLLEVECEAELLGRPFHPFFNEESRVQISVEHLKRTRGESSTYQTELITARGQRRQVMVSGAPIIEAGRVSGIIGTFVDVTESRRIEGALLESERRYRYLVDHAGDAMYIFERRLPGRFIEINQQACNMLEYTREQLLGMSVVELIAGRTPAQIQRTWEELTPGRPVTVQASHRHVNGSLVPVEVRMAGIDSGGQQYVLALARDMTERKATERALRESEARTRAIVDSALDAVISFDADTSIVEWNPAAKKAFGYSREEALGKRVIDLITPTEFQTEYDKRLRSWILNTPPPRERRAELVAQRRSGEQFPVEVSAGRIVGEGASTFTVYLRDLTDTRRHEAELRARQELFDRLMEHTPAAVFTKDHESRYLYANRTLERLLGKPAAELLGRSIVEMWSSEYSLLPREHDLEVLRTGQVISVEEVIPSPTGPQIWAGSKFPLRMPDGTTAVAGTTIDVTARRQAESALKESEERYRRLIETAEEGIWVIDPQAVTTFVNGKMAAMLGWEPADMLGRPLQEFMFDEDWEATRGRLSNRSRGIAERRDVRHRRRDGSELWSSMSASAIFDDQGRHTGTLGMMTDITNRRRAEQALLESSRTLEALFAHSPLGIVGVDANMVIQRANPAAAHIVGLKEPEMIGRPLREVLAGEPAEQQAEWESILAGKIVSGVEVTRRCADGRMVRLRLHAAALRDASGVVTGVAAVFADVSESERLKEQLLQSQKMEAVGRLSGAIAHDFGNMLAVITGYAEALLRHLPEGAPLRGHAEEIERAANRGALLIRQLLAFNRRRPDVVQRVRLGDVMAGVERMLSSVVSERISLTTRADSGLPPVEADHAQLEQVLVNLALNARDAMPAGGTLMIDAQSANVAEGAIPPLAPGRYVRLQVIDSGHGMDEQTRARVFEPFFTTKDGTGTGLGLNIVQGIVTDRGGIVRVRSEPGKGTTFEVYLPAAGG